MRAWLAFSLALSAAPALAAAQHVVLLVDVDGKPVREAEQALVADGHTVEVLAVKDAAPRLASADDNAWLAIGRESAAALASSRARRRAALLTRRADLPAGLAAVALDVDPTQQLEWIARAFPGRTRVLVLRDKNAGSLNDAVAQEAAKRAGLTLVLVDVRAQGETVPALESALRSPGAPAIVWVVPDKTAITVDTIAPLTQAALSARVPLVGFSSYFLRVGALAAVVVDNADVARQAVALANAPGDNASSTAALVARVETPRSARLVVDGRLAQRLGIPVKSGPGVEVRK